MDLKEKVRYTTIVNKYPSFRDEPLKACWRWLEGRQEDDDAEGFWRIHNKIYNLQDFIEHHPGGREWIELTKGIDITEAFESYHIYPKAPMLLQKFYVKDADKPRNYRLTYEKNGFYNTLKERVAKQLLSLDKSDLWKSKFYLDVIVILFFITSILAVRNERVVFRIFFILSASQFAAWINSASHNFTHQRNNWRMYMANLVLVGWRDWRVFHGMSHHLYPNSYNDLEVSAYEPFFYWIPVKTRPSWHIVLSYMVTPFAYLLLFHKSFGVRFLGYFFAKSRTIFWDEFLTFLPPLTMFLFGCSSFNFQNFFTTVFLWMIILHIGSLLYSIMAINVGHHGITVVHEGDEFQDLDFGIYQLAATVDRIGAADNLAIGLTHFGDHSLHHLFPSLDQALLPPLRQVLIETCEEFRVEFRKWKFFHAFVEQFKQLGRTSVIRLSEERK